MDMKSQSLPADERRLLRELRAWLKAAWDREQGEDYEPSLPSYEDGLMRTIDKIDELLAEPAAPSDPEPQEPGEVDEAEAWRREAPAALMDWGCCEPGDESGAIYDCTIQPWIDEAVRMLRERDERIAELRDRAEKAEKERDFLVGEYERAVKCEPLGFAHAASHIFNAIVNARCDANADRLVKLLARAEAADEARAKLAEVDRVREIASEQLAWDQKRLAEARAEAHRRNDERGKLHAELNEALALLRSQIITDTK